MISAEARQARRLLAERPVAPARRRALALTRLRAAADDGAFDLELFEDKRNYRR
ncbi:hypothetical protein [Streptomyces sp. SYSU K21746]